MSVILCCIISTKDRKISQNFDLYPDLACMLSFLVSCVSRCICQSPSKSCRVFFAYFVVEPGTSKEILVLAVSTLSPQLIKYVPAPSLSPPAMTTDSAPVGFNSIVAALSLVLQIVKLKPRVRCLKLLWPLLVLGWLQF